MPPTGKKPSKTEDSSADFDKYFSMQFGVARWRTLAKALQKETTHVALLNLFASNSSALEGMKLSLSLGNVNCFRLPKSAASYAGAQPDLDPKTALRTHYWLDLASVYPVLLLGAMPGMTVLDVAAAPGGKSLVLAHQMFAPSSRGAARTDVPGKAPAGHPEGQQQQETALQQAHEQQPAASQHGADDCPAQPPLQGQACSTSGSAQGEDGCSTVGSQVHETVMTAREAAGRGGGSQSQVGGPGQGQGGKGGLLMVNEPDATRRSRLQRVLTEYLPHAIVAGTPGVSGGAAAEGKRSFVGAVRVLGHEAEKYWSRHEFERYHRVLLDAPCSNDRHVVQQSCARRGLIPSRDWSLSHCRQLASLQLQLLVVGLRALAVGGRLVYSTCSLAQMENDGVVNKALERCPNVHVVMPTEASYFPPAIQEHGRMLTEAFSPETTKHGVLLLPDQCGHGPIYVSVLEKGPELAAAE